MNGKARASARAKREIGFHWFRAIVVFGIRFAADFTYVRIDVFARIFVYTYICALAFD